jgi:cation diffusion facilitator CzcD-associated flavoprotein CzcO
MLGRLRRLYVAGEQATTQKGIGVEAMSNIETDYLIVGAGAAGMAFADALIADSDADVVLVDRRHRPGGHWNEAHPAVRGVCEGQVPASRARSGHPDRG